MMERGGKEGREGEGAGRGRKREEKRKKEKRKREGEGGEGRIEFRLTTYLPTHPPTYLPR